ncbi:hypothetical protein MSROBK_015020 [Spiroplasma poulsonii]|uniref:Uncharacterized protein n=1 Tax=Spiroplasma poulsonii TaxID=2138 RepID=A0A2P6FDU6_9MOLU|nr:hypothetical protein MSROBK_015020 [Spiroplasma poulsonii]PQM31630.1 hypothetical protein SMSRO_SF014750 [Spiroplasma poulsonii]PWF96654.1 hypothetical protein SMSE_21010 [Spiroplasma poulsonii]PWF97230.1 hypothetical protein SMH99_20390 [Spiroplasma poulsonii]
MEILSMIFSGIVASSFLILCISLIKYLKFRRLKKHFDILPKKEKRKFYIYKILWIIFSIIFVVTLITFISISTI